MHKCQAISKNFLWVSLEVQVIVNIKVVHAGRKKQAGEKTNKKPPTK